MSLSKIRDFLSQNKKAILLLVTALLFLFPDFAFATQATTDAAAGNSIGEGTVVEWIQLFLRFVAAVLGVLTSFVSIFLSPGWVNGEVFGMTNYLKEIWILISNIVYFIFAFILIAIAFMNIMGKGDKWELKQALPKFIVGVIMVPFSWFFVQFVISLTSILTVSVLSLPYDSFGNTLKVKANDEIICTNYTVNLGSIKKEQNQSKGESSIDEFIKCNTTPAPKKPYSPDSNGKVGEDYRTIGSVLRGDGDSIYSIIAIYTYEIINIHSIDTLLAKDFSGEGAVEELLNVALDTIFDLIFIVVYFILMVALFLALFTRGIGLWLYAMFSPLFGLFYFFGGEGGGELGKKFSLKEFFGLALVPVYVAAALSFGLLFLFVASHGISEGQDNSKKIFHTEGEGETKSSYIEFASFKFKVKGTALNGRKGTSFLFKDGEGGTLGRLIMELFGLAILWIAVMAALKQSTITEKVSSPIADFGKSVGDLVMKSPTYAPIFGGLSASGLQRAGTTFSGAIEGSVNQKGVAFGNKYAEKFGVGGSDLQEINNLINGSAKGTLNNTQSIGKFLGKLNSAVDIDKLSINEELKKKYLEALEFSGAHINDTEKRMFMDSKNAGTLATAMKKIIDHESDTIVQKALQDTYGTSMNSIKNYLAGSKASTETGDMTSNNIGKDEWNSNPKLKGKELLVIPNVDSEISGVGEVYIEYANKNGGKKYNVNITTIDKSATNLDNASNDDINELIRLYSNSGKNKNNMKEILSKLSLKEELFDKIKDKYDEKKNK